MSLRMELDLDCVSGLELYLTAGEQAVAGFPLPCGAFPVAIIGRGMVQVLPAEWERYKGYVGLARAQRAGHHGLAAGPMTIHQPMEVMHVAA